MVLKSKIALRTSVSTMKQLYFTALFLNFHHHEHTDTHTSSTRDKRNKIKMEIFFYSIKI